MKFLFLAEKPLHQHRIAQEFAKHNGNLSYTIDVACVSGYVTNGEGASRYIYETCPFENFSLKTRTVPEGYKVVRNYLPERREELTSLLQYNAYDYIVNACSHGEAGDLMFDYTRETCEILDIPTLQLDLLAVLLGKRAGEAFQEIENQISNF